ncbi:MAG: hypothetical protein SFY56_10680 [Bacteroidota bacterium]|nr:hypothetical protein [Bacteroidota bacterium]
MTPLITPGELEKIGVSQLELLQKFNEQLIKDFERGGVEHYLKPLSSFDYATIHEEISKTLSDILTKESGKYQQLLYLIDIPEKDYNLALNKHEDIKMQSITDLIIKRILQKVVLKLMYSKK